MSDLDTLAELILAAKAQGDEETAAWLAGLADEPDELRKVLADAGEPGGQTAGG